MSDSNIEGHDSSGETGPDARNLEIHVLYLQSHDQHRGQYPVMHWLHEAALLMIRIQDDLEVPHHFRISLRVDFFLENMTLSDATNVEGTTGTAWFVARIRER